MALEYDRKIPDLKENFQRKLLITPNLKMKLFPYHKDKNSIKDLKIDPESVYFITTRDISEEMCQIIISHLDDFPSTIPNWSELSSEQKAKELVVTDMTAGVGGNTILFGKYFKYVNAIEIDYKRYTYLKSNINVYNYININVYHGDSLDYLINNDLLSQDIIFIDPPWGGSDYKLADKLTLTLGPIPIDELCQKLMTNPKNKMILLKLPRNYNFNALEEKVGKPILKYDLKKMVFVMIKNYQT